MRIMPMEGNDWYFVGKSSMKYYQYPSSLPEDDIITLFKEDLVEIVSNKLEEILERQDTLIKQRELKLSTIGKMKLDDFARYWFVSEAEFEFVEFDVLQRWLKYWLRLAMKSGNNIYDREKIAQNGITEEQVAQAKEVPLESVFEGRLRRIGTRFIGLCPFHEEKTPSFTIFSNTNNFYCFGCHVWGDPIDLYMKLNQCNLPTAVKALIYG